MVVGSVQATMRPAPTFEDFNIDDSTYLDRDGNPTDFNDDSYQDLLDQYNIDQDSLPADDGTYDYDTPTTNDTPYQYQ